MTAPRKLSISRMSPHFNEEAARRIDKVLVDNVVIPHCFAYDMDAGWAFGLDQPGGSWQPRVYGVVTVVEWRSGI